MSRRKERQAPGKHNRAAFSRDDVEDARRGRPDFDLRDYASQRGLEFLDHATPAGFRAAVPCEEELQSNVLRGTLPGGEHGVLAHEGLEMGFSIDSMDWGGTFYDERVTAEGVGLLGLLPFSGRSNTAVVRAPCTVAGVRVSETVGIQPYLRIDTRRSSPPFSFPNRVKLGELVGDDRWSVWGDPRADPAVVAALVAEPVGELLRVHAEDGLFQAVVWWGTLVVRRNGFLGPEPLDELGRAASLLAQRLRAVYGALGERHPFETELPAPSWRPDHTIPPGFTPTKMWCEWATRAAERYGMTLEDPVAYHRAFPSAPIPGMAHIVLRGSIPGIGPGRLVVHRERDSFRPAVLLAAPPDVAATPPEGVRFADLGVRLEVVDGLLAVWNATSYWGQAMVGDLDAFHAAAATAITARGRGVASPG